MNLNQTDHLTFRSFFAKPSALDARSLASWNSVLKFRQLFVIACLQRNKCFSDKLKAKTRNDRTQLLARLLYLKSSLKCRNTNQSLPDFERSAVSTFQDFQVFESFSNCGIIQIVNFFIHSALHKVYDWAQQTARHNTAKDKQENTSYVSSNWPTNNPLEHQETCETHQNQFPALASPPRTCGHTSFVKFHSSSSTFFSRFDISGESMSPIIQDWMYLKYVWKRWATLLLRFLTDANLSMWSASRHGFMWRSSSHRAGKQIFVSCKSGTGS